MPVASLDGCSSCLTSGQQENVLINLLVAILQKLDPMADVNVLELSGTGCASCLMPGQKQSLIVNLLTSITDNLTGAKVGLVDPNGVETGMYQGQFYVQWNEIDTVIRVWYFLGTVGENTGWS